MTKSTSEMTFDEAQKCVLSNKEIEVKPIIRERPFFKAGHDGEFMFSGCNRAYKLPYVMSTSSYFKIFEDQNEQRAFEILLNKPEGSLNIYNFKNEFWGKEEIVLGKDSTTLDLSIPSHNLHYRILKSNTKFIAPNWAARFNPQYQYALVDKSVAEFEADKASERLELANDLFAKVKKSDSKMYNILRVLGKKPNAKSVSNTKWLKGELLRIIDQRSKPKDPKGLYIESFISVAQDKRFDEKVLIFDAMEIKEIEFRSGYFRMTESKETIGKNLDQAVDWLHDIKNQEAKLRVEARLQLNN